MRSTERLILVSVGSLALLAALWLLVISPKLNEASDLSQQVETARGEVITQQLLVSQAEGAQAGFDQNYSNLVFVGKAVPGDADTPALLTQILEIADQAEVAFQGITLETGTGSPTATAGGDGAGDAGADQPADEAGSEATDEPVAEDPATAVPVEPTEAAAANKPLGATVGPAGLPVMPYTLTFSGDFFEIAEFFGLIDDLVGYDEADGLRIDGRLITIDGFTMEPDQTRGFPDLTVTVRATTFISSEGDGIDAGATGTTPAPAATDPGATDAAAGVPVAAVGR